MKKGQRRWTREESILAINLYCKLPFGRLHQSNPEVIALAELIGRTPGSVAFKLVNFASLDPSLQARGIKGAGNTSKLDRSIWGEFYDNWEELAFESELLLAEKKHQSIEQTHHIHSDELPEGKSRERWVKTRVNQAFFRQSILASYNYKCCITGIAIPELLVAGHIKPWSIDRKNRMNPGNGIAINGLHDKAFERGLISISTNHRILISGQLKNSRDESGAIDRFFLRYENREIFMPSRFLPETEFLRYHNEEVLR